MPTPVTTARQCLTPEAAQALDEAVAVARRRVHAQTTSLHAVSALLSLPSSALREACSRARSSAYSAGIQFKALELCLGVSLDRLPSSPRRSEEPPISNSLMAAIKRSQANQRRQPESFHLYQQQQQSSSVSMVKVELQNLVLSILDDPVVSRVFGEAGFRSCDIKLAILRPVHQLLRYSRYRGPPMFLCNLTDENFRRIGEVLKRPKGRNPLLIGGCANDALHSFCETLERRKEGYCLPVDIYGLNVIRMGADVSKFVGENSNEGLVKVRFKEVALMVEHFIGPGVIISYGDVKELVRDQATITVVSCVIEELTRLQDSFGGKVWLIGAVETYETYWKFLNRFPMVEKDWDLRLLPITSLKPALEESYPKSSLMESFVPFGGFFSTSELRSPFGGLNQCSSRCHLCNEKYEQEVYAIVKRGFTAPDVEQSQYSLPSWLEMTELSSNRPLEVVKTRDEGMALSAKVKCLQRKWGNICQRLHHASQSNRENLYEVSSQVPPIIGHKVTDVTEEDANNCISDETNRSFNAGGCGTAAPCMSTNFQKKSSSEPNIPLSGISKDLDTNVLLKKMGKTSEFHDLDLNGLGSPPMSNSSVGDGHIGDGHTSPPSTTSIFSDLGLRIYSSPINKELKASTNLPFSCSLSDCNFDQMDAKMLYRVLTERISWQEEAVSAISQAIIRCRTRNEKRFGTSLRGDIWFNFLGPDNFSKKKIAVALVEILYGNRGNFIRVDLNSQDGIFPTNGKYDERELNGYDVRFRGKNVVDHIAWELSRKPLSVVFLENIVKADVLVQNSLSQALRTGKFPDSHGREVGINNTVFVTTSSLLNGGEIHSSAEESSNYPEESLLRGQKWPVQMVINCHFGKSVNSNNMIVSKTNTSISYPCVLNKTKLTGDSEITEAGETLEMAKRAHRASSIHLDLNLPAEELGLCNSDVGFDSMSEKSKGWLEEFFDLVDETVVFKPFDFVKIAEEITKEIAKCFDSVVGLDCLLEIDSRVMDQILASVYLSDKNEVEDWVKQVLSKGFVEARARYNLASPCIVKLITREGHFSEERAPGVCLPARIIVE